jgi:hypothetical protein
MRRDLDKKIHLNPMIRISVSLLVVLQVQRGIREKKPSESGLGRLYFHNTKVIVTYREFAMLEAKLVIPEIIFAWFACGSVVTYTRCLSPKGIVMRLIFSYSASTYLPLPIFEASWLLDFQAFTAISSDFLLSSEVSRLVTPGR